MLLGRWVRVERDLNWKTGLWYLVRPFAFPSLWALKHPPFCITNSPPRVLACTCVTAAQNVYYRRTRRFDAPLITDLLLLPDSAAPPGDVNLTEYTQAEGDFRDGVYPKRQKMRLWYKTRQGNTEGMTRVGRYNVREGRSNWWQWDSESDDSNEDSDSDSALSDETTMSDDQSSKEIITELDILYGEQQPFFGFERVKNGPVLPKDSGNKGKVKESVDLVFRRGNPRKSSSRRQTHTRTTLSDRYLPGNGR